MAVEAHHLHLFPPQLLTNRDLPNSAMLEPPLAGAPPPPAAAAGKKRPRDLLSFLGDDLSSYFHQQMLDLDRLLLHHAERMRLELAERRRRFSRQLAAAIENGVSKRLRAKDDEIERMRKMNWAMEERIRTLSVENEIWKELAQTNESTANLLRTNLEQLLAAQIRIKEERIDDSSPADDAESCCCGGGNDEIEAAPPPAAAAAAAAGVVRGCRRCGGREATVLILPCRHLCICSACAPVAECCPVCNSCNSGTVNVNLS